MWIIDTSLGKLLDCGCHNTLTSSDNNRNCMAAVGSKMLPGHVLHQLNITNTPTGLHFEACSCRLMYFNEMTPLCSSSTLISYSVYHNLPVESIIHLNCTYMVTCVLFLSAAVWIHSWVVHCCTLKLTSSFFKAFYNAWVQPNTAKVF